MSLRLSVGRGLLVCLASMAVMCVMASGAAAQSIFSDLFGFTLQTQPPRSNGYMVPQNTYSPRPGNFFGGYRTICVRTCDGYYFPISHSTQRHKFYDDAKRCQARCPGQARMFYAPASATDIKWATDVSGLTYKELKTAFLYRKKLVKGCSCRPAPWAPEERARHKMYETEETEVATLSEGNAGIDKLASDIGEQPAGALPYVASGSGEEAVTGHGDVERWKTRPRARPAGKSLFELSKNPLPRRYNHLNNGARADGPQFLWSGDGR